MVSGVGTGGTPVGLYPAGELECCSFSSRIPGVADRISDIFREDRLPGLMTVEVCDDDAIDTTRQLMRLGFPVGPSSGLNYRAAVEVLKTLDSP